jgi:NAD(P)H-dependent FMN reductase
MDRALSSSILEGLTSAGFLARTREGAYLRASIAWARTEDCVSLKTVVLVGSVRSDRQGIKAAKFVERTLISRGHDVSVVDPAALQLPILDRMYKEYPRGQAPAALERLASLYRAADAFVVVSGEYNHSIPPALSNLLDHFLEEYYWRPSAIVCYSAGGFGGVRAAMQLRAMLCELGMPSISSLFPIPKIQHAFDDEGCPTDPATERYFARFASELEWYAEALRDRRARGVPY